MKQQVKSKVQSSRQHRWQLRMKRFSRSVQSVAAFCAAESVSVASFYYWRAKLSQGTGASDQTSGPGTGFIEVDSATPGAHRPASMALAQEHGLSGIELRLELGDGVVLQIRRA